MLAMVDVSPRVAMAALTALAALGVPQGFPAACSSCRAFAAVGTRPEATEGRESQSSNAGYFGEKRGNAGDRLKNQRAVWSTWPSCHASTDIAYAAMMQTADG